MSGERRHDNDRATNSSRFESGAVLVTLANVEPEDVRWLWPRRLAMGKLTLLVGDAGQGKSYATMDIVARVSRGSAWPDGGMAPLATSIILTAEDGIRDTVRPRIERQGGDPERVAVLTAVRMRDGAEVLFNLDRDIPVLDEAIHRTQAELVVIDPLVAYIGRDSFKDAEVRTVLAPLAALADRRNVAILAVMHLRKAAAKLIHRAGGSVGFVAAARIVLAIGSDVELPARRFLVPVKTNLGVAPLSLAFRIDDKGLHWESQPLTGSAEGLLGDGNELTTGSERREREEAKAFLLYVLREGPVSSAVLMKDATANGIAQRTLWRAKRDLGIEAYREPADGGRWRWRLPSAAVPQR
jgi:putative DNA primase/helicase